MGILVRKIYIGSVGLALIAWIAFSCGEKIKLPTESPPSGNLGDTLYLLLNPPWDAEHGYDFSAPGCLYFGRDTYLYAADTGNDRILQLDAAGTVHRQFSIVNPISISQDEMMRLLVVTGEKKVYKIDVGPGGDGIPYIAFDYDRIPPGIPSADTLQYLFKLHAMLGANDRFMSVTDLPSFDKSYFVAVSSEEVNNGRVLWFWGSLGNDIAADSLFDGKFSNADADTFRNPVVVTGNGVTTTTFPNFIYAYLSGSTMHLIVCQDAGSFPVHDMKFERQVWDRHWVFNFTHTPGQTDILSPGLFDHPVGAAIDPQGNIYIVDNGEGSNCSGIKFSRQGELLETLCEADSSDIFDSPGGMTYDIYGDRRTLYVADSGNNRILRFKLSTDLEP
jgi:DNA-binding beta-propeller fold protein YncE